MLVECRIVWMGCVEASGKPATVSLMEMLLPRVQTLVHCVTHMQCVHATGQILLD